MNKQNQQLHQNNHLNHSLHSNHEPEKQKHHQKQPKTYTLPINNQLRPLSSPNIAVNTHKNPASVSFSDMTQIKYMSSNGSPRKYSVINEDIAQSNTTSKTSVQTMYQSIKKSSSNSFNSAFNYNTNNTNNSELKYFQNRSDSSTSSRSNSSSSTHSNSVIRNVATYNLIRARSGSPKFFGHSSNLSSSATFRGNQDKKLANRSFSSMGCKNTQNTQRSSTLNRKLNYSNTINTAAPSSSSTSSNQHHHHHHNHHQHKQLNPNLSSDQQVKFIQRLESEIDLLSRHKNQLDAQLARLPFKTSNSTVLDIRKSVENERRLVESKLSSAKLELRGFNVIKM